MNGADVGVVERRGSLCFPLESGQRLRVLRYIVGEKRQRYVAVQPHIFGLVGNTHPTSTELLDNLVVGDGLADKGRRNPP